MATELTLEPAARVLLVLAPTRIHPAFERAVAGKPAGESDVHRLSKPRQLLMWKSHTQFLKANPRPTEYMLKLAYDFLEANAPAAQVDLLIDSEGAAAIPGPLRPWIRSVHSVPEPQLGAPGGATASAIAAAGYDTLILLYRDGTGLGWGRIERRLRSLVEARVLVLNGRRRAFELTGSRRRALRWRRFVETSWLTELALVPALLVTASALALVDAVVTRPGRNPHGR